MHSRCDTTVPQALCMASSSKPMVIFLDGLAQLSTFDPASSMRWLPRSLPRYVHVLIGYALPSGAETVTSGPMVALMNRRPSPVQIKVCARKSAVIEMLPVCTSFCPVASRMCYNLDTTRHSLPDVVARINIYCLRFSMSR